MKFDMHVHTHYSHCSNLDPAKLPGYAKEAGLSGFAVTDHNTVKAFKGLKTDLIIIPGIEVSTADGHLVGLFVTKAISPGLPAPETADLIRDEGGLVVAPHPCDRMRKHLKNVLETKPDFIETFNSRVVLGSDNKRAEKLADKNGIKKIAGSDAHFKSEVGNAGIMADASTVEGLRNVLEKGDYTLFGKSSSPTVHVRSTLRMIGKRYDG